MSSAHDQGQGGRPARRPATSGANDTPLGANPRLSTRRDEDTSSQAGPSTRPDRGTTLPAGPSFGHGDATRGPPTRPLAGRPTNFRVGAHGPPYLAPPTGRHPAGRPRYAPPPPPPPPPPPSGQLPPSPPPPGQPRKQATTDLPPVIQPTEPDPRKLGGRVPKEWVAPNAPPPATAPLRPAKPGDSENLMKMRKDQEYLLERYGGLRVDDLDERYRAIRKMENDPFNELTGHQHTKKFFNNLKQRDSLSTRRPDISRTLLEKIQNRILILTSATGSGKSTEVVTQIYLDMLNRDNRPYSLIACTQPKRLQAFNLYGHVSNNLDSRMGDVVGMAVRGERDVKDWTPISYVTDGTLLAEILNDPSVLQDKYGVIIIDEAHERTKAIDILLHFLKQEIMREGSTVRLVIMSATLDRDVFSKFFEGCPYDIYDVEGPSPFPVQEFFSSVEPHDHAACYQQALRRVEDLISERKDTLVFLPGQPEIEDFVRRLQASSLVLNPFGGRPVGIYTLYAKQSHDETEKALKSWLKKGQETRVIVATNLAESGVTLRGMVAVVNSGRAKLDDFHHQTWAEGLDVGMISKSSVRQRKGRVGRTEEGEYWAMFTNATYENMTQNQRPALLRQCLVAEQLRLLQIYPGVRLDAIDLPEPPDPPNVDACLNRLLAWGCIDEKGDLTQDGHDVAQLPCDVPFAIMMLVGARLNRWSRRFAICVAAAFDLGDPHRVLKHWKPHEDWVHLEEFAWGDVQMIGEIGLKLLRPEKNFEPVAPEPVKYIRDLSRRARELSKRLDLIVPYNQAEVVPFNREDRDSYVCSIVGPALKLQTAYFYGQQGKNLEYRSPTAGVSGSIDSHSILSQNSFERFMSIAHKLPGPWAQELAAELKAKGVEQRTFYYTKLTWYNFNRPHKDEPVTRHRFSGLMVAPVTEIQRYNPSFQGPL